MRGAARRLLFAGALASATASPAGSAVAHRSLAEGDVVRSWNERAFETVRAKSASDAQAARP